MQPVVLGSFAVHQLLGQGGMGRVWSGIHQPSGVPVAIKVIATQRADAIQAFAREVRAVAAMDHENVVAVYEQGVLSAEVSEWLGVSGPFLIMELADAGSLWDHASRLTWSTLRLATRDTLLGLGYIHANNLIHRDIKPANILGFRLASGQIRWRLADFGIAHLEQSAAEAARVVGTPAFMAPEQVRGAWREQGPWTDLYALGCMVWSLVAGEHPFRYSSAEHLQQAHLYQPPPPLVPRMAVPAGLEAWLHRSLEKRPRDRFRCAADALCALAQLGDAGVSVGTAVYASQQPTATWSSAASPSLEAPTFSVSGGTVSGPELVAAGGGEAVEEAAVGGGERSVERAPLPASWNQDPLRRLSPRIRGVGLGLFGLRPIPLVGRGSEQAVLWGVLRAVREEQRPQAVILRGAAGVGKSRLAEWLAIHGGRFGGIPCWRVAFREGSSGDGGLRAVWGAMVRGLLCGDLAGEALRRHFEAILPAAVVEEVVDVYGGDSSPVPVTTALLSRAMRAIAGERGLVVWLDDAQWGQEAVVWVGELLRSHQGPILVLLTVQEDALRGQPEETAALAALAAGPACRTLSVLPLESAFQRDLVVEMVGLSPALAEQIAERTDGNPLFAVQWVGDWVQRGWLVPDAQGFVAAPGVTFSLPVSLQEVWFSRVEAILSGIPEGRGALERAATLGLEVEVDLWVESCEGEGGGEGRQRVLERLLQERLAVEESGEGPRRRWRFVHGMLREALLEQARQRGTLAGHHRACARVLATRGEPALQIAIGRHLLAAGDADAAVEPLLQGLGWSGLSQRSVAPLLVLAHQALGQSGRGPADPRRARLLSLEVRFGRGAGDRGWMDRALSLLEEHRAAPGWDAIVRHAHLEVALYEVERSQFEAARVRLEAIHRQTETETDVFFLAKWTFIRGVMARMCKEPTAHHWFRVSIDHYAARNDELGRADGLYNLGLLARDAGDLARAMSCMEQAIEILPPHRFSSLAIMHQGVQSILRQQGDLERAIHHSRISLRMARRGSSYTLMVAQTTLLVLLLDGGYLEEAATTAAQALQLLEQGHNALLANVIRAAALRCAAAQGRRESWEVALHLVLTHLPDPRDRLTAPLEQLRLAVEAAEARGWGADAAQVRVRIQQQEALLATASPS